MLISGILLERSVDLVLSFLKTTFPGLLSSALFMFESMKHIPVARFSSNSNRG